MLSDGNHDEKASADAKIDDYVSKRCLQLIAVPKIAITVIRS
jgi:hypothetical protein